MDIKDKLTEQDKMQLKNLGIEVNVLQKLLNERKAVLNHVASEILAKNGLSPDTYSFIMNPGKDLWEAELKEGALILPNRQTRRSMKGRNN